MHLFNTNPNPNPKLVGIYTGIYAALKKIEKRHLKIQLQQRVLPLNVN